MHPIIRKKERIVFSDFAYNPNNFESWWNFDPSFIKKFIVDDGVHFNAHGHSIFAHQIMIEIEKFKTPLT